MALCSLSGAPAEPGGTSGLININITLTHTVQPWKLNKNTERRTMQKRACHLSIHVSTKRQKCLCHCKVSHCRPLMGYKNILTNEKRFQASSCDEAAAVRPILNCDGKTDRQKKMCESYLAENVKLDNLLFRSCVVDISLFFFFRRRLSCR